MYGYSTWRWECDCTTHSRLCNGSTRRSNYPRHPRDEYLVKPILPFSYSTDQIRRCSRLLKVLFELPSRVGEMYRICRRRRRIWCHRVGRTGTSHATSSNTGFVGGVNLLKPEQGGLPRVAGKSVLNINTWWGQVIGSREILWVRRELECRTSAIGLRDDIWDGGGSRIGLSWWTSPLMEHLSSLR